MTEMFSGLLAAIMIVVLIALVFLPTVVAFKRKHRNKWIILLMNFVSLFLGSPFGVLGWIATLAFSLYKEKENTVFVEGPQGPPGPMGPMGMRGEPGEQGEKGESVVPLSKIGIVSKNKKSKKH